MGPDCGERWRASDSAGSALVLLVAGGLWMAVSVVTGIVSVAILATRPSCPTDVSEEL
jgi:hypothetical protein